ncbi:MULTISPECIES: respiratory chain protein [Pyrobaculum]|uniref:Respiratory chain protein n=1 Tax=Pyrobaculum arsenaticum TaxID=121277 RepID=A0A7L4P775_9CREN|nr:respiratory chain protein [Pyrobaculum arsenaticum]MCY0890601.1 respiratory chain protein [Pyrobaculum arsenaticum]NYR14888.1 respiratory chain protein [Pyrobaculum arsenaticum]
MWSKRDTILMVGVIWAVLLMWLFAVDFGRSPFPPASPISQIIFNAYTIVVISAGVVASIFIGAMIYFVVKFKERGHGEG